MAYSKEYDLAHYHKNRERHKPQKRRSHLKSRYGITEQDYENLMVKQNGKCAVCDKTHKSGRRLAVDHDHNTGLIRGLLCVTCNSRAEKFERYLNGL